MTKNKKNKDLEKQIKFRVNGFRVLCKILGKTMDGLSFLVISQDSEGFNEAVKKIECGIDIFHKDLEYLKKIKWI